MQFFLKIISTTLVCLAVSAGVVYWLTRPEAARERHRPAVATRSNPRADPPKAAEEAQAPYPDPKLATFPDPNAPGASARVFLDPFAFDDKVFNGVARFMEPVGDEGSLHAYREAISGRSHRAMAMLREEDDRLRLDSPPTLEQAFRAIEVWRNLAFVSVYEGDYAGAASWIERALPLARTPGVPPEVRAHLTGLLGIVAMRRGEQENCIACVGPSSCILPIAREAVHTQPAGSRDAVRWFTAYLTQWPGDLRIRWLLNIAQMTLGEYPEKVPPEYLVPIAPFRSKRDVGRFDNVAQHAGLGARGPDLAGGSIFDDFDGDGRPDLFVSSFDVDHGASLYRNRGDGTFEDRSASAGLEDQVYALNVTRADFDNDGRLDVLLLRGGWERPAPMSLLRNKGGGTFEDVTKASGLGEPIASESAAWGDYDNDGDLDLFVCGEYIAAPGPGSGSDPISVGEPDPRNHSRLYRNRGDGTFVDVAAEAGVRDDRWAKGSAWGDYDDDGRPDLFVSNMNGLGRLYHNEGDGTFRDVAAELGIEGPPAGFTCLFWDFDNDGWQDLLVADYSSTLAGVVADSLGLPAEEAARPRLFRNLGGQGFRDVSREVGMARPMPAMSMNIGDIDNDGYLDVYFGTGWMTLSGLVPNALYKNVGGARFEDVTESSGTGHLQKGHGVSFADYDGDGDVDLFSVLGGGFPGDRGYSALFRNPGHGRHWLKLRLVGTRTNRSALGANVRVDYRTPDGTAHSVHRVIGNNGSFGGNSLTETIGLLDANTVDEVHVTWPTSGTTQTYRDLAADQSIEITEGADSFRVIRRPPPDSAGG